MFDELKDILNSLPYYSDYRGISVYNTHKHHWHNGYDKKYDERQKLKRRKKNKLARKARKKWIEILLKLFNNDSIKLEFDNTGYCTISQGWGGFSTTLISLNENDAYTVVDINFDQGEGGDEAMKLLALYIVGVEENE